MKEGFFKNVKYLVEIYWTMFVIGITTFGGGYAMVAIIEKELGVKKKWISTDELLDYIAISQITPGIIAVNVSTFVGRKRAGLKGAIAATLGMITPSIIIILIIAALLTNFADNQYVQYAFAGIRICVCVLILNAVIKFVKQTIVDWLTLATFICVFIVASFTGFKTVYIVLCVIALSVIITIILSKHPINSIKIKNDIKNNSEETAKDDNDISKEGKA